MLRLHRLLPFLTWPRLTPALLRGEALAGLAVALLAIPQAVAYAGLAGMPPVTGIYACLLPALVAVLFSTSSRVQVGPTALICLMVGASLTGLAEPGSPRWIELAVWLALLSGLAQLILGFWRGGWLLNLVSAPVLTAFTQAAAVLIIAAQLPALLGYQGTWSGLFTGAQIDPATTAFGLLSLACLLLSRRWWPRLPMVLGVMLMGAGVAVATGFEGAGGAVVGDLAQGLPSFYQPSALDWPTLRQLLLPALAISLVSFLETASSAKADVLAQGRVWNPNQDLIGQGLAKMASGFSGSFATSASFSRSALNLYTGARSGWAGVLSVACVLLALLLFTPLLRHVPRAVLAAIVLMAVLGLIRPGEWLRLWRVARAEAAIAGLTFAATLLSAPQLHWGVLTGVLLALAHFLVQHLHPRIIEVGQHADGSLRDRHLWALPPLAPHVLALRMDAALDFASASRFEAAITAQLTAHPETRHLCLFAQPINHIDATGVETFMQLCNQLHQSGITLHISGLKLPVENRLRSAGALAASPLLKLYRADAQALLALQALELAPLAP